MCGAHSRRMGTGLSKVKSQFAGKRLEDGKTIAGCGRLMAERIDRLQTYYGLAIRRHKNNLEGMKKEAWAGLYHSASTDNRP